MIPLFDRARHEPLLDAVWDEGAARQAIARVAAAARAAFTAEHLWPIHPEDAEDGETGPHTGLYFGAAGVIWALDHLLREGAVGPGPTFAAHLDAVRERNRATLESAPWRQALGPGWQTRSWLFGDAGILYTRDKIEPDGATRAALAAVIAANQDDPSRDLMWGAAGTMLPALALFRRTGDAVWRRLFLDGAEALHASLTTARPGVGLWTQSLYGTEVRYLGAVHGFAGNVKALLSGRDLFEPAHWRGLAGRFAETLRMTAVQDGEGGVNWPAFDGQDACKPLLLQVCHGAPGMIVALGDLEEPIDDLLLGGGALTWRAGPPRKGSGLCHGAAGNGFAFLRLFERTGDEIWLWRARRFAMHALARADEAAAHSGRRRFSLWTGDLGVACFLWECVRARARFPTLDEGGSLDPYATPHGRAAGRSGG